MKKIAFASLLSVSLAYPVLADENHHKPAASAAAGPAQSAGMNEGEVRRVDKDAKKITIRHGPLEKLEMPAMTMVFQVKDPAMLDQVKAGDKIKFDAEKIDGAFTVVKIEPAE
jgi:Cu(I)/Ag(I) efflux system periplasmic protein CusF